MAKQYDESNFNQLASYNNREPKTILPSNDDVSRIYAQKEPHQQRASYCGDFLIPGIANDDPAEQLDRSKALRKEFQKLKSLRSDMSKEEYQRTHNQLLRGMLTLCRDPSCSASPVAKRLDKDTDQGIRF